MNYDIAIIGGGPAGYHAAEKASNAGLRTVLFEKDNLGGVCLNEGCIPTKTLLYSAKILDTIKGSTKYGIQVAGNPTFELTKIIARKNKTVKKLVAGIQLKLNKSGVEIVRQEACLLGEDHGCIKLAAGEDLYFAKDVLVCSGSETIIPPIEGLAETSYWTSKEALDIQELPASLVVIGGGVIGMEFASFFNSLGVKVTVVEMLPEILGTMDKELSSLLRSEYTKKGIQFLLNTRVISVNNYQVIVEKNGETTAIETEKLLLSVGRRAKTHQLGLEQLSVEVTKNGLVVNEYMQTSHPHLYACGDLTGRSMLAHTAIREGEVAVNHILGQSDKMNYKSIPSVVYTNPEVASVGMTEEELSNSHINYRVEKLPMTFSGRFMAENELFNGLFKLILDERNHILGCHLVGNPASELIVIAGIAMEKGFTLEELKKVVFPHPTVGELFLEREIRI